MPWRPARLSDLPGTAGHVVNQLLRETNGRIDDVQKAMNQKVTGQANLNFGSIPAQTCIERNIRAFNASRQGVAHVSPSNELGSINLNWSSYVSAQHTVTVRVCNPTSGAIVPNVIQWKAFVQQ